MIYPSVWDNSWKRELIPDKTFGLKALVLEDESAYH